MYDIAGGLTDDPQQILSIGKLLAAHRNADKFRRVVREAMRNSTALLAAVRRGQAAEADGVAPAEVDHEAARRKATAFIRVQNELNMVALVAPPRVSVAPGASPMTWRVTVASEDGAASRVVRLDFPEEYPVRKPDVVLLDETAGDGGVPIDVDDILGTKWSPLNTTRVLLEKLVEFC